MAARSWSSVNTLSRAANVGGSRLIGAVSRLHATGKSNSAARTTQACSGAMPIELTDGGDSTLAPVVRGDFIALHSGPRRLRPGVCLGSSAGLRLTVIVLQGLS